jgi:TonB family protein
VARRIGRYEVQAELGRGGFGRVFRAFDPTVGRMVAIKVLSTEASERDLLIRFRNEAAAAGKLQHRNIVTIYDFGEQSGTPYIIMELLEGQDLQRVIAGARPLSLLAKVQIMSQIAQGLNFAHRHGVIHRDVKPANVMLLADGTVKIMDFGIALLTQATGSRLTPQGSVVGTFRYMAPEQFMGSNSDRLSDIFSYGVMYYELVTGTHPFDASEPAGVMFRIMQAEPAPMEQFCPGCPTGLQAVVSRLLSKDRERRYQSLEDAEFDAGPILIDLKTVGAADLLLEARQAVAADEVDTAQRLIREILDLDPSNSGGRELRGLIQTLLRRRAVGPRVDALMQKGREHMAARRYPEALHDFESAVGLDDSDPAIGAEMERARAALEQAQRVERMLSEASDALGRQDLTGALQSANAVVQADPENARAAEFLQSVRQRIDQRDRERRIRETFSQAKVSLMLQAFDEAIRALEALQLEFPDSGEIAGLLQRARSEKQASERNRRLVTRMAAAKDAVRDRRFADAAVCLEGLAKEFSETPEVRELLAYVNDEIRALERDEAIDKTTRLALALLEEERYDEALQTVHDALRAYPGEPELLGLAERTASAKNRLVRARALQSALEAGNRFRSEHKYADALHAVDRFSGGYGNDPEIDSLRQQIETDRQNAQRMEAFRRVLDGARDLIRQGHTGTATQMLTQAKAQYPADDELTALLSAAQEADCERQRARAILKIREHAEERLAMGDVGSAVTVLDGGLQAYPDEESLTRLRNSAVAFRSEHERRKATGELIERCKDLRQKKSYTQALSEVEGALREFPGDRKFIELQQAIGLEAAIRQNQDLLNQGCLNDVMSAVGELLARYPDSNDLKALLLEARTRKAEKLRNEEMEHAIGEAARLQEQGLPDRAIALLEPFEGNAPAEWRVQPLLARYRDQLRVRNHGNIFDTIATLRAEQRFPDALRAIDEALAQGAVKNDAGLMELRNRIEHELQEFVGRQRRERDLATLRDISVRIATARGPGFLLKQAQALVALYPGDTEFQHCLSETSRQGQPRTAVIADRKRLAVAGAAVLVVSVSGFALYRALRANGTAHARLEIQRQTRAASAPLTAGPLHSIPERGVSNTEDTPKSDVPEAAISRPKPAPVKPLLDSQVTKGPPVSMSPPQPRPRLVVAPTEKGAPALPLPPAIPATGTGQRPPELTNAVPPKQPDGATAKIPEQPASGPDQKAREANAIGLKFFNERLFEESIVNFSGAIRLSPDYAAVYANRGGAYYKLGEFERAIADFDHATKLDPKLQGAVAKVKEDAQRKLADGVFWVGKDISSPVPISFRRPKYSKEDIRAGKTGSVQLRFIVDKDGKTKDMEVLRSVSPDVDERAITAVKRAKFKPGLREGRPVAVEVIYDVPFSPP